MLTWFKRNGEIVEHDMNADERLLWIVGTGVGGYLLSK